MKTARIKKGGKDFFLENMDSRISIAHEKVSGYRQKGVPVKITGTVLKESEFSKIRMVVQKKYGFLIYLQRKLLLDQILSKRMEIISRIEPHFEINEDDIRETYKSIVSFYASPDIRKELEEIKKKKESAYLMPSESDIRLLAECCFIRDKESKEVILITDDSHFTEF